MLYELFSFDGRISRKQFWWYTAGISLANFVTALAAAFIAQWLRSDLWNPLTTPVFFVATFATIATHVKRWHDLNRSAWWALTSAFCTFVLIFAEDFYQPASRLLDGMAGLTLCYIIAQLGLRRGAREANVYGPSPAPELPSMAGHSNSTGSAAQL